MDLIQYQSLLKNIDFSLQRDAYEILQQTLSGKKISIEKRQWIASQVRWSRQMKNNRKAT